MHDLHSVYDEKDAISLMSPVYVYGNRVLLTTIQIMDVSCANICALALFMFIWQC